VTLAAIRIKAPRVAAAYEIALKVGVCEAARRLGLHQSTVSCHVGKARRMLAGTFHQRPTEAQPARESERQHLAGLRHDSHTTRCRCGLSLPCYQCVQTIWQAASSRSGAAHGEF